MADDSTVICVGCQKQFAEFCCCCSYPLPRLCSSCVEQHRNKLKQVLHIELPIQCARNIESEEEQLRINHKFRNISGAEEMLKVNLRKVEDCKEKVRSEFGGLIRELQYLQEDYLTALNVCSVEITDTIHDAVKVAKEHALDPLWPESVSHPLAKLIWEFQLGASCSSAALFTSKVTRPPVDLKSLIQLTTHCKTVSKDLPQRSVLALVVDNCLHELNTATRKWSSTLLKDQANTRFRPSWDSVFAYYSDNSHLLCTGGSSPLSNAVYTLESAAGTVLSNCSMLSRRCGHGLTQYKGKFYAFGGFGAGCNAEKFSPEEDEWTSIGKMRGEHQYFTSCLYMDKIYLCGGNSAIVEFFDPETQSFTEITTFHLEGPFADSSCSVTLMGDDLILLSPRQICCWKVADNSMVEQDLPRALQSEWANMAPVSDGVQLVFLPNAEEKLVKVINLLSLDCVETLRAPEVTEGGDS